MRNNCFSPQQEDNTPGKLDKNHENSVNESANTGVIQTVAMVILGVAFFPVLFTYFATTFLSTRSWLWRLKENTRPLLAGVFVAIPFNILFSFLLVETLRPFSVRTSLVLLILFWFSLIPMALIVSSIRLNSIAVELSEGRLPLSRMNTTKRALLVNGVERAKRDFNKLNQLLPLYGNSKRGVVALNAHPADYRTRAKRKSSPDETVLKSYLDGNFVVSRQNPNSPTHMLVVGSTGAGKTTLLSHLVLSSLAENWRVVLFDFKGGAEEKKLFTSLGRYLPNKKLQIRTFPGNSFDLFRGSGRDIADKLISCLPAPTGGDGDFHRQRMVRALSAVISRTHAPLPRDIDEVINRVRNGGAYAEDELDRELFATKERGVPLGQMIAEGLGTRFEPLRRGGAWSVSGGFSWSDGFDVALFSLDATREGELLLGDLILQDFDIWLKSSDRERNPKPILLIVDEAGALERVNGSRNIGNIVARGRSSRVGVVLASQTLTSLGADYEELNQQIAVKWIGRMASPQLLIDTIGTRSVVEASYELVDGKWQVPKAGREQRGYIVDPDVIRGLPTFVWNLSEAGRNLFVYAPPLDYKP